MANKRTRDRHLAKLAARRQAERVTQVRRRNRIIAASAGGLTAAIVFVVGMTLFGGGGHTTASPKPSASPAWPCSAKVPKTADQKKPTFKHAPPMTIDPQATYLATMKTSCGTIELKLLPKVAPVGVNSFVFLADQGFYDGLKFHRIVSGFVIQGGDPKGDGSGGPGYKFDVETNKHVKFDAPGILAYANGGPGTNGSQFFITLAPAPQLDPTPQQSFTIFGKVIHGKKIVAEIGKLPTSPGPGCATASESCVPATPVYIFSVKIVVQPAPSSSPSPSPSPSA